MVADLAVHRSSGRSHSLDEHALGLNCPVPWDVPHEDPALVEPLREFAPGLLRFPGGTVANFFNWRSGQLEVDEVPNESVYRSYIRSRVTDSQARHPKGAHMAEFKQLADAVGAEVMVVANLETSSVEDQVEWFQTMKEQGVAPRRVELGNEFYHAMLDDPTSRGRFPDYDTTMALIREYAEALRAVVGDDARFAVQAAPSRFHFDGPGAQPTTHYESGRIWSWDDNLRPEPWFDAVTVHPYPSMDGVAGPGARKGFPDDPEPVFRALMARVEEGVARCVTFLIDAMPGKEIWITEWGMGEFGHVLKGEETPVFTNAWVHALARYMLTAFSFPAVRYMAVHAMYANGNQWAPFTRRPEGGYAPWGMHQVMRLFNRTVNGGVRYQGVDIEGVSRIEGEGMIPQETYATVAGALFETTAMTSLLVQNATGESLRAEVGSLGLGRPSRIQAIVTPDLTARAGTVPPAVRIADGDDHVELPAYSVQRVEWDTTGR